MTFAVQIGERFLDLLPLILTLYAKNKHVNGFSRTELLLEKIYPRKKHEFIAITGLPINTPQSNKLQNQKATKS